MISDEILAGRFRVGDRLPAEREFAETFGVSRNVVREAIARLRFEGAEVAEAGLPRLGQRGVGYGVGNHFVEIAKTAGPEAYRYRHWMARQILIVYLSHWSPPCAPWLAAP